MVLRFLEKLDTPRRHLAILVGLLLVTFVLTGVLAYRTREAEVQRRAVAQGNLQAFADNAATKWNHQTQSLLHGAIPKKSAAVKKLAADAELPLDTFAASYPDSIVCPACESDFGIRSYFALDLRTGEIDWGRDSTDSAVVHAIAKVITSDPENATLVLHENLAAGYYHTGDAGAPLVLAYTALKDGAPVRVVGMLIEPVILSEMLRWTFSVEWVGRTDSLQIPDGAAYSTRATVGQTVLFDTGLKESVYAAESTLPVPFTGARIEVGIPPISAASIYPESGVSATLTLAALVVLIATLLGLAILLVKREAELVRLRADFVASASHELRTPLAQIRMFTETLLLGRVRSDLERRRSLEIVDQEARRLSHLVENLLQFSKTEGGRPVRLAPEPTSFAAEIRRAVESFGPLSRTHDADIRVEVQEGVSAAVDRNALRQILVNLLDNALKYGPDGQRLTVGLALFDDAAQLWVDDEGPGIPATDRERVFESFYRMRRDIDARITGSGIGLAVVRQLAKLHGGDAWADAAPGGGARIVVQFPGAYLRADTAVDLAAAS